MARRTDGPAWRASSVLGVLSFAVACATPYAAVDPTPPGPSADGGAGPSADGGAGPDGAGPLPDGAAPDGAVPTGCNPASKFGLPMRVEGAISGADEDSDAKVSEDELSISFASDRGTAPKKIRLHTAVRTSTAMPWTTTTMVLERGDSVFDPNFSPSALRLVYQRGGKNTAARIMLATRDKINDQLSDKEISLLGTAGQDERDPFVVFGATDADPFTLVYSQNGATAARDLFVVSVDANAVATNPTPLSELNGASNDRDPVLSRDGLEIFFASDRAQAGVMRIYHATRASGAGKAFTNVEPVSELVSAGATNVFEAPTWISANRCVLYFSSDRSGTTDVWRAVRSP